MLQVSRTSIGFHHGALGNVIVLVHLIVASVVRQLRSLKSEMGQYFRLMVKKSPSFSNIFAGRALDDDGASVSLGQAQPFIDVQVGPAVFGSRKERFEWPTVIRITSGSLPSSECWQWTIRSGQAGHHGETRWAKKAKSVDSGQLNKLALTQKGRYSRAHLGYGWCTRRRQAFSWQLDRKSLDLEKVFRHNSRSDAHDFEIAAILGIVAMDNSMGTGLLSL
ncbi:hypothetical protein TNCV_1368221 [Trichonephila clavipes]|nr:hypothetical protein TNCV_1368221 [Trichonephila clavipes]